MILNINIDQESYALDVPEQLLDEAADFFVTMNADMDKGWQMGRFWVESPSLEQRCQIAANKLVDAFHNENKRMFYLMAAYILKTMPGIKTVTVNLEFEIDDIDFEMHVA
ncbi:MAG: hypothetical protein OEY43_07800 [Gammaproteobacteria bacterium]|nr:hypothetical protein [Gammaproteobacteria bacterium]